MKPIAWITALMLAATVSASEPLTTFVLAGQSNMVGKRCKMEKLPEALQGEIPKAYFFHAQSNSWIPLAAGVTERSGFGPEIAFAAAMVKGLGKPVGIIKVSRGGTNLHKQWNPAVKSSLFNTLAKQVDAAGKVRPIHVAGMLWVQGGADAKTEEMAKAYSENLRNLVQQSRERFGNCKMPFLSGRIPPKSNKTKPHWRLVRSAQQDLELEGYRWVECDDIPTGPDKIHYDEAGMIKLGERQADLMLGIMEGNLSQ